MIKIDVYNLDGKVAGDISLSEKVFGLGDNNDLVHQVYVAQAANRRSGSAHTKIRGEKRGGGKKPWKQKGTGNARTGSIRNPIWKGGGVVFGPRKDINFYKAVNTKMRKKALLIVLSAKIKSEKIIVVESLSLPENKTKFFVKMLDGMNLNKSVLMNFGKEERDSYKAARNIKKVNTMEADKLNVFDLMNSEYLVISENAIKQIEDRYIS